MSRVPSAAPDRLEKLDKVLTRVPLKDTSKNFVNSTINSKTVNALNDTNINLNVAKKQVFIKPLEPVIPKTLTTGEMHAQQLTSGDRVPNLVDCSTPKKDGQVPYLTSNTINNALNRNALTNTANTQSNGNAEQQQRQVIAKKMTGNELSKWQQTWRDIMPKSHIFFEQVDPADHEQKKSMLALKRLGATIELFFNENITIIVSKRPYDKNATYPANDVFRYASKKQLKIWSIEKVFRFLSHLGEPILKTEEYENENIPIATTTTTVNTQSNTNLSNMLMNEKLFGPSDRDPNAKRSDFKYFTGAFLYIWDFTHKTRPVAIREWKDKSYPRMNPTTNGKSLFTIETKSQNPISILKRHQRRYNYLKETADFRDEIIQAAYKVKLKENQLVSLPNYAERVEYMKAWEDNTYSANHSLVARRKLRELYDSLNDAEKEPFREMFEDLELAEWNYVINSTAESFHTSMCKGDGAGAGTGIDDMKIDELEEEDDEIDEVSLRNLISDKSDDIDKMNPVVQSTGLMRLRQEDRTMKCKPMSAKIPKLTRQDSTIISNSQTTGVDGKMRDYGEITASGIQASGVNPSGTGNGCLGNGLAPSKSSVVNKLLANESKRIIVLSPAVGRSTKRAKLSVEAPPREVMEIRDVKEVHEVKDTSLIPDDIIKEIENEQMKAYKLSANEDELAALRSVEERATNNVNNNNPFISEGYEKCHRNEHSKKKPDDNAPLLQDDPISKEQLDIINTMALKEKNVMRTTAAVTNCTTMVPCGATATGEAMALATAGVFKKQKHEKGKHEMKPGYCENCRVKYSDFSDHVETEKHRSFAENDLNFKQIDSLIDLLRHARNNDLV